MVRKQLSTRETSNRVISALLIIYYLLESIVKMFIPFSMMKHKNVEKQNVLITGGGSGIGQLLSLKFLKLGANVIIWDVSESGMETTKKMAETEKLNTKNLHLFKVDLCDSKSIYAVAEQVKQQLGPVDILINNAGVVSGQNLLDIPDEKIELTFRVNSMAHFYTIKAFLPDMIKRKNGHIVTIASVAGRLGVVGLSDYCASKYANIGMDEALRMELVKANLNDVIKTTLVQPYFITTGMFAGAHPGVFEFLTPSHVVDQIMEAVLTETPRLVMPTYLDWLLSLHAIIPLKCAAKVYDFVGGFEFMTNFHGRSLPPPPSKTNNDDDKQKLLDNEINNNYADMINRNISE